MAYAIINENGRKMLCGEFATKSQQAHLDLIYGAKLGDTKKGNADALKYMKFKVKKIS